MTAPAAVNTTALHWLDPMSIARRLIPRAGLLFCRFDQQVLVKLRCKLRTGGVDRSKLRAIFIISHSIFSWRQSTQLDRSVPIIRTIGREECIVHFAGLFDYIRFGDIVAIDVEI